MGDRQTYFTLRGKSKKDYEFSCYYPEDILPIRDCVYILIIKTTYLHLPDTGMDVVFCGEVDSSSLNSISKTYMYDNKIYNILYIGILEEPSHDERVKIINDIIQNNKDIKHSLE